MPRGPDLSRFRDISRGRDRALAVLHARVGQTSVRLDAVETAPSSSARPRGTSSHGWQLVVLSGESFSKLAVEKGSCVSPVLAAISADLRQRWVVDEDILQAVDDPCGFAVAHSVRTIEEAQAILTSEEVLAAVIRAGMVGEPTVRIGSSRSR